MANIKSFPNNQDVYTGAEYVMKWLHGRTSGVFGADRNAAVTAVTGKMAINVSDGYGWMSNAKNDGIVWWIDSEKEIGKKLELPIKLAESALNRIDRVVVTWQTTDYVALPTVEILEGNPSSMPAPPALTNSSSKRQISLAQISVPAGTTKITADLIMDERLNSEVCGIVTDRVGIDTSVMEKQFKELLAQMQNDLKDILNKTVPDGAVTTPKIDNEAVTTIKISENAVVQEYEGNILTSSWKKVGNGFESNTTVEGALPTRPFFVDLNLANQDALKSADLMADFGLIFDTRCDSSNEVVFRASEQPTKDMPIKILIFKR